MTALVIYVLNQRGYGGIAMIKSLRIGVLIAMPWCLAAQSASTVSTVAPSAGANGIYTPLTPEQKVKRRALRLIEPVTLVTSAFGAGIDQWRNVPEKWGQGSEAYAIRFAS